MNRYMRSLCSLALAVGLTLCAAAVLPASEPEGEGSPPDRSKDLNYAQVEYVEAIQSPDGRWCIYTTVRHNDEGWDHYANAWQVLNHKGHELAWRLLAHPHDDEQPFVREQCRVNIMPNVTSLTVKAKCNVHGFGGREVVVDMSLAEGEKFKVVRRK